MLASGRDGPVLVETVAALLRVSGSFSRAAEQLWCHRNAVIHRVRRVREVCAHDPVTADGALVWGLALLAREQGAG